MKKNFYIVVACWLCVAVHSAQFYHNGLSAVKDSDAFLIVRVNENQKIVLTYVLPQNIEQKHDQDDFLDLVNLKPGTYIFPLKEGRILRFAFPMLKVDDPEKVFSLFIRYRELQTKDEFKFFTTNVFRYQNSLRMVALKRLQETGFFDSLFDRQTIVFFKNFYANANLSVPEKRLLLECFALRNFRQMKEIYVSALADNRIGKFAGKIFHSNDPETFSAVTKRLLLDNNLWHVAVKNSEFLAGDHEFCTLAMKYFDYKNPYANAADFVPILFTHKSKNNYMIIKMFLNESKNTHEYELYYRLSLCLNNYDPKPFKHEIMNFLASNRQNQYIADSIIFPTMISALRKAGHPKANDILFEYLHRLKKEGNKTLIELTCLLLKKENQPIPKLDDLIMEVK